MPTAPKKAPAKKKAAPAKKVPASKKAAPAKKVPASQKAAPAKKAAPVATDAAPIDGEISSWDPSSGEGLVTFEGRDLPFDVFQTTIENEGYVDLHVGRPVKVSKFGDSRVESFSAE